MSWLSICFIVSSATPTTIRIEMPENPRDRLNQIATSEGSTATEARNSDPGSVIRDRMCSR